MLNTDPILFWPLAIYFVSITVWIWTMESGLSVNYLNVVCVQARDSVCIAEASQMIRIPIEPTYAARECILRDSRNIAFINCQSHCNADLQHLYFLPA